MGYDVNYNELDYAQAEEICWKVFADIQGVVDILRRASLEADRCQEDLRFQCAMAGITSRGYSLGLLADRLRVGMGIAETAVHEGRNITERVGQVMRNYEVAEASVQRMMLSINSAGLARDFMDETLKNGFRPPTENMETFLQMLHMYMPVHPFRPRATISDQIEGSTRFLSQTIRRLGPYRDMEIRLTGQDAPETVEIGGKLGSYFQLHQLLEGGGPEENGKFMVVQADEDTYVVVLPGTQDGSQEPTPFDALGIADAFGVESENFAGPIGEALRISGAKEGDEVILSGYSQGGIHAAQLVKNKFLKRKYKMSKLLTLGSPIGNIDIPENVRSLSVEDKMDMVPGTDGTSNPNRGEHYTTTFPGPREKIKDLLPEDGLFGPAHNLRNYGDHLAELDDEPKMQIREHLLNFHLPENIVQIRKFKIERKAKKRPPVNDKDVERLKQIAPPH